MKTKVYFSPIKKSDAQTVSKIARRLLERLLSDEKIKLELEIPLKIHPGQPGNVTFIKPDNFAGIIDFLLEQNKKPYFIETGMVTGPRSLASNHKKITQRHGFTRISFLVADGENGEDSVDVPVKNGQHFQKAKIAKELADKKQVIVLSHFKGHCATGFGATIKMLGIGFASRRGKIIIHTIKKAHNDKTINWSDFSKLYCGDSLSERVPEYAQAAILKKNIYFNFALNITDNCDCDEKKMLPVYSDLGIFASIDPLAIDKACFDELAARERNSHPFAGAGIFNYGTKLGLGSLNYQLIEII